jgi:hypothetical protein
MSMLRNSTVISEAAIGSDVRNVPPTFTYPVLSTRPSMAIVAGAAANVERSRIVPLAEWICALNGDSGRLRSVKSVVALRKTTLPTSNVGALRPSGAGVPCLRAGSAFSLTLKRERLRFPCWSMAIFAKASSSVTVRIRARSAPCLPEAEGDGCSNVKPSMLMRFQATRRSF